MTHARTSVFCYKKLSLTAVALASASLFATPSAHAKTSYNIPVFTQQLVIEGGPDRVEIAPVFGDKAWAFTARWDDNNANSLNMHAAVADIEMPAAGSLTIASGFPVIFAAVDGEEVKLSGGQTPPFTAGQHRVLMVFDTEGKHAFSREFPQALRFTVEDQPVTWLPAPAIE
ncbi:hypothetical protein H5P28_08285 [Ruficoccus amylovorans]|uniref:Uncharacterized protein n=1 Tax=Ruficoccus amylovorans TaxID=1804625 RepID=A0A842HDZ9_9BACT|nr:hypothetical protein [Ruficoccus amylovorans]MBC2594258.1 hypothetical protein [Ruficoccus amylovorans]